MADNKDNIVRTDRFQAPSSGAPGDGGDGISIKDYIDSRDDAIESRLAAKLDNLVTKGTLWGAVAAVVGAIFTALAITLAVMAFGGDRFKLIKVKVNSFVKEFG